MSADEKLAALEKDEAYRQRNHLVAALARLFPSGIRPTNIEGWDSEWHGCVLIDLPSGQISYHYHDSQAHLFSDLPPYTRLWDGHDKELVHERLSALTRFDRPPAIAADQRPPVTGEAWQPIETAPKDGTFILLYCKEDYSRRWLASWQSDRWYGVDDTGLTRSSVPDAGEADWQITHWQPLPSPPLRTEGE